VDEVQSFSASFELVTGRQSLQLHGQRIETTPLTNHALWNKRANGRTVDVCRDHIQTKSAVHLKYQIHAGSGKHFDKPGIDALLRHAPNRGELVRPMDCL
jgi:hypothetical protein